MVKSQLSSRRNQWHSGKRTLGLDVGIGVHYSEGGEGTIESISFGQEPITMLHI